MTRTGLGIAARAGLLIAAMGLSLAGCGGSRAGADMSDAGPRAVLSGQGGQASGTLLGQALEGGGAVYRGIQYATASLWEESQAVTRYGDPQDATHFGPICPQVGVDLPQSQDCLSLNIWTPDDGIGAGDAGEPAPVMVFLPGGGFVSGYGSDPQYDGTRFAQDHGVVLVTVNYRLGAFGYLATDGTGGMPANGGNYGLGDQIAALRWVRNNISAFGGDPERVTVAGESAGAMSVGLLQFSAPQARGLFRATIQESNSLGYPYRTVRDAQIQRDGYLECLNAVMANAKSTHCAKGETGFPADTPTTKQVLAAEVLFSLGPALDAQQAAYGFPGSLAFAPIIDGTYLTVQPQDVVAGGSDKPTLMGFNRDEGVLFALGSWTDEAVAETFETWMGPERAAEVMARRRYNPYWTKPAYGLPNSGATALSRFWTDGQFQCASMALNRAPTPGATGDVWVYEFTQPTATVIVPPAQDENGVCAPENQWGNSCHASELPFVFGTLPDSVPVDDQELSGVMNAAWAAFVRDPTTGPGLEGWTRWSWSGDRPAVGPYELARPEGRVDTNRTFTLAHCPLWLK